MAGDAHDTDAPTEALVAGTVGDRCVSCGAPLSSDQRYCVVCGERRGAPRFTLPAATAASAEPAAAPPRPPRRARLGSGPTLVAGVATLLLAMLVGVLIGHNTAGNGARTIAAGPTKVIKVVEGGGAAAAAPTTATTAGTGKSPTGSKAKATSARTKSSASSKQTAKQESTAASKVTGGSGGAPPTVTVGQTGSGAGYSKKTHKFNGSFFGQ